MTDEDLREHAREVAKRHARGGARRKLFARLVLVLEKQREKLLRVACDGPDDAKGVLVHGPHIKGLHGSAVDSRQEGNMIRGLCKRIASRQVHNKQAVRDFGRFVQRWVDENVVPIPYVPVSHELLDEGWLNDSKYNTAQKEKFHELLEEYMHGSYRLDDVMACKVFIKREITEEIKEPRIISSRSDMYKAIVAPYIRAVENIVYDEHFIKHCSPAEVQERIGRVLDNYSYFYETDYSSFESSFSQEFIKQCERRLFKRALSNNPEIWRWVRLACKGQNRLVCPHLWAELPGSRMSGEMWTSLANGFSNMMMIRYMAASCLKRHPLRYDFVVEGDDGLIGVTHKLDTSIARELGFTLTLREGAGINDLSFCGMILGPGRKLYVNPDRVMIKLGRTMDRRIMTSGPRKFERLCREELRSKALSMAVYGSNNPVLREVLSAIIRNTQGAKVDTRHLDYWESDILRVQDYWDDVPSSLSAPLPVENYEFASKIFNIGTQEMAEVEEGLRSYSGSSCFSILRALTGLRCRARATEYYRPLRL